MKKVRVTTGVRVELTPPKNIGEWLHLFHKYRSPEYWDRMRETYQEWADELMAFIRDHRSQDKTQIDVVTDTEDQCSKCSCKWETVTYEGGTVHCAGCGDELEPDVAALAGA